jgi:hypothetical protein
MIVKTLRKLIEGYPDGTEILLGVAADEATEYHGCWGVKLIALDELNEEVDAATAPATARRGLTIV